MNRLELRLLEIRHELDLGMLIKIELNEGEYIYIEEEKRRDDGSIEIMQYRTMKALLISTYM